MIKYLGLLFILVLATLFKKEKGWLNSENKNLWYSIFVLATLYILSIVAY